jgi:hypothetical protein
MEQSRMTNKQRRELQTNKDRWANRKTGNKARRRLARAAIQKANA